MFVGVGRVVGLNRGGHCLTDRSVRPLRRIDHFKKVNKYVSEFNGFCSKRPNIYIALLRENLTPEALRYGSHSFYPAKSPYPPFTS